MSVKRIGADPDVLKQIMGLASAVPEADRQPGTFTAGELAVKKGITASSASRFIKNHLVRKGLAKPISGVPIITMHNKLMRVDGYQMIDSDDG